MKTFETPNMEIHKFDVEDVITTSVSEEVPETTKCPLNDELPCLRD